MVAMQWGGGTRVAQGTQGQASDSCHVPTVLPGQPWPCLPVQLRVSTAGHPRDSGHGPRVGGQRGGSWAVGTRESPRAAVLAVPGCAMPGCAMPVADTPPPALRAQGERGLWPGGAAAAADGAALGGRHLLPELQDHPGLEIRECPHAHHPYPAAGAASGTLTPTVGTTWGTLSPPCGRCPRHPKSLVWAPQTHNVDTTLGSPKLCCGHQPGHPKAMVKPEPLGTPTPGPGQRRGTPSGAGGCLTLPPPRSRPSRAARSTRRGSSSSRCRTW